MPSRWEVTQKIYSLTNVHKVTAAMNVIASLRLRKLTARGRALAAFEAGVDAWLSAMTPALREWQGAGQGNAARTMAVVFTSDRGLCGSHNHGIHTILDRLAADASADGRALGVIALGSRGAAYARRRGYVVNEQQTLRTLTPLALSRLADDLVRAYQRGEFDALVLVYNRFVSTLKQFPRLQTILPLSDLAQASAVGPSFEGSVGQLADDSVPLLIRYLLSSAHAHSQVSEQAARMTAMDSASKNARDLLNRAVKERNRVRQKGITNELMEVISGKEAMKR